MGTRLDQLLKNLPDEAGISDTLDYAVGALYGLERAVELNFVDRPGKSEAAYRPFLTKYVHDITEGRDLNRVWLAGFYFNSAIQRLAACYERVPKLLGGVGESAHDRMASVNKGKCDDWRRVYGEVNAFKHDPKGRWKGRKVTMENAVNAMGQFIAFMEEKAPELCAKFSTARE